MKLAKERPSRPGLWIGKYKGKFYVIDARIGEGGLLWFYVARDGTRTADAWCWRGWLFSDEPLVIEEEPSE